MGRGHRQKGSPKGRGPTLGAGSALQAAAGWPTEPRMAGPKATGRLRGAERSPGHSDQPGHSGGAVRPIPLAQGLTNEQASESGRTDAMLSAALKRSTNDHLAPHEYQLKGAKLGAPPSRWNSADVVGNMRALTD